MYPRNDGRPIQPICFCIHRNVTMGTPKTIFNGEILRLPPVADGLLGTIKTDPVKGRYVEITRLQLVTAGIRGFLETALRPDCPFIPDVALLQFGANTGWVREFRIPEHDDEISELIDDSKPDHCLGEALNKALDAITERVSMYRREGTPCLRPILIVVSAGRKNYGPEEVLMRASGRCSEQICSGELTAVLCGTTNNTSMELLRDAAPGGIVESVSMTEIPEFLKKVWKYVKPETAQVHNPSGGFSSGRASSRRAEKTGNAEPYILGIFKDVE